MSLPGRTRYRTRASSRLSARAVTATDKPEYKVKLSAAFCFSNKVSAIEYYHNCSWLEHGGAPEKAAKSAFVCAVDGYIRKAAESTTKNESKITLSGRVRTALCS